MINEINLIKRFKELQGVDTLANMFISDVIKIIKKEPKVDKWIPCSEQLPEEPEELPTEDDFIERMILDREFEEYNVTIYGASKATTLYYVGNGNWYDELSSEYYKVVAWQPLPEPYIETVGRAKT